MTDTTGVSGSMQASGDLAGALQDLLRQLVDNILGGPSHDKEGRPLQDVCYMQMVQGDPIDPRDFSFPWDPAGGTSSEDFQDDGKQAAAPAQQAAAQSAPAAGGAQQAPVPDVKLEHALASARNTAQKFDQMLRVTDDGSYRPFTSAGTLSSSYEAIITKAQGIPAPPLPADIQKQVDAAQRVLHVFDDQGNMKGFTKAYKTYQALKQAYADAEAAYANAEAAAMTNAALGQTWPVTSKSYKAAVDNAYDDWRSSDADKIENALETVKSVGGSIGAHFVAEARALYDAWSLGLSGSVAAGTPYTQVMPGSWYDPNDTENGFTKIIASHSQFQQHGQTSSSRSASGWYNGHSSSTSGSAGGMVFGVTFGGSAGHSQSDQHSGSHTSGGQSFSFGSTMSSVTIKLEYGLCTIYRPWLLKELFVIDGWYLPGEKNNVVSDGTIGGQKGEDDKHLLPMIPTRFLVLRNISITADGWGSAGTQMSQYCTNAQRNDQSSSTNVSGGVGFLCFGGAVSHQNADWSGDDAQSASAAGSWFFSGDQNHGTLSINGCQIVGYIGEIMPASPQIDGTKKVGTTQPAPTTQATTTQTATAQTTTAQPEPAAAH
jgi:hypothetical protein